MKKIVTNEQIKELVKLYQSPLYLYDEQTIINNIFELKKLLVNDNCRLNYASKANSNLEILKIIKQQGLGVDSTGIGEIFTNEKAGFTNEMTYCVGNNFTKLELKQLIDKDIVISVDSIDQLEMLAEIHPVYQKVMLRLNPTFGEGENSSIITGGTNQKFGIDYKDFDIALTVIKKYELKLIGLNQHIGSSYLDASKYIKAVEEFLDFITAKKVFNLKIIDLGGGFGINYMRSFTTQKLDFDYLNIHLKKLLNEFISNYDNKNIRFDFEPGRYAVATAGILIGEITSVKKREAQHFVGTNLGFTSLIRPTLYDAYHEIYFITDNEKIDNVSIVGNICESGDYLCKNGKLIVPNRDDLIVVKDVGAYGYCLCSNYNNRLKPMEILKCLDGSFKVIRKRQTLESLLTEY